MFYFFQNIIYIIFGNDFFLYLKRINLLIQIIYHCLILLDVLFRYFHKLIFMVYSKYNNVLFNFCFRLSGINYLHGLLYI